MYYINLKCGTRYIFNAFKTVRLVKRADLDMVVINLQYHKGNWLRTIEDTDIPVLKTMLIDDMLISDIT